MEVETTASNQLHLQVWLQPAALPASVACEEPQRWGSSATSWLAQPACQAGLSSIT